MRVRMPWASSSNGSFSYTTIWLNLAALITVVRYAVGEGITIGSFSWQPGELDATLVAATLGALGALYGYRRTQESKDKNTAVAETA